jgi:hypothetical protein
MSEIFTFPSETIRTLIANLREDLNPHDYQQEGWVKSKADPSLLLKDIESLRLKKGYVLRAYTSRSGGNGNGVVWAMPESSPFSEPKDCLAYDEAAFSAPRPPSTLEPTEVIEGDGSPWSYFCASLLMRELWEFGALWHGTSWGACSVITSNDPWVEKSEEYLDESKMLSKKPDWEWDHKPESFKPSVTVGEKEVKVQFVYYDPVGRETLCLATDNYQPGKYIFKSENLILGYGKGGIIF